MSRGAQFAPPVACAAVLGLASALGDWIWARFIPDGAVLPGVAHGVLLFAIVALVLGWAAGSRRALARLLATLPAAGLTLAAAFYLLFRFFGYLPSLLLTWALMWWAIAALQRRARGGDESRGRTLVRGAVAAIFSGLAFWSISGIWTDPPPGEPDYALRFVLWTFAFLPGFLALLLGQAPAASVHGTEPGA